MKKNSKMIVPAFAVVAALTSLGASDIAFAKKGKEKCFGVAKAGANDCGSSDGRHGCAGASTKDYDKTEWMYVDQGTCEEKQKLVASAGDVKKDVEVKKTKKMKKVEKK